MNNQDFIKQDIYEMCFDKLIRLEEATQERLSQTRVTTERALLMAFLKHISERIREISLDEAYAW